MTRLLAGLALFIGVHIVTMLRGLRAGLIARFGEGPYKGVYSLLSAIGLALIVWGFIAYRAGGYVPVWEPPVWTRHLALLLLLPVFPLLIAAYRPGRIKAAVKHPMLLAVKIWATAHLLANGDLGSILLFGAILVWAVADRISVGRRAEQSEVVRAEAPDAATARRNDMIALAAGLAIYGLLVWRGHEWLFGVAPLA